MEKKEALAKYLECEVDDIQDGYRDDVFEYGKQEYLVCDDYDDAYEQAVKSVENLIDDIGFTFINGWENYVDDDWFSDAQRESAESYIQDIEDENDSTYENRLIQELVDGGYLDEEDDFHFDEDDEDQEYPLLNDDADLDGAKEEYIDSMCEEDPVEWYKWNFGNEYFEEVCKKYNLIDARALAEYCVDNDGPANELASYDGDEIELEDGYLAYRLN